MTNILVVEDDFAIRELICRTLAAKGYQMSQVSCGAEAVSVVDRESPDLILLDVNLPDIDGFSLHRHLGDVPVIYITARDEVKDRLRGFELGAYDYLVKPFDLAGVGGTRPGRPLQKGAKEERCCFADRRP